MDSITTQTFSSEHGVFDVLENAEAGWRMQISRKGAELISLQKRDAAGEWHGLLHRDGLAQPPEQGWGNHATVMGYFIHRLWQEQSTYQGHTVRGGNHGFLRHFEFTAPKIDLATGSLRYQVPVEAIPPEAYPYRVAFSLEYSLSLLGLKVAFTFENRENFPVHLSFGLHPGFAVASRDSFELDFPAGQYLRLMAPGNFLSGDVLDYLHAGGAFPLERKLLPDSFIYQLSSLKNRHFQIVDRSFKRSIHLDFSEVPYLTIWSDNPSFLCFEPCWGLPDSNPPVPFQEKAGIQQIPAGETLEKQLSINCKFI